MTERDWIVSVLKAHFDGAPVHFNECADELVSRSGAPAATAPDDAARLLGKMNVVQAYADAAYIASVHAHHALWAGLLEYGWDEKTEAFGKALADRISKEIATKAKKIGLGQITPSAASTVEPVAWRIYCTDKSRGSTGYLYTEQLPFNEGEGILVRREPEPLYAAPTTSPEPDAVRKALEPFARAIEWIECTSDHKYSDEEVVEVKIGDLRRARIALASSAPVDGDAVKDAAEALCLLAAYDDRLQKLHDLLETIREQIRTGVEPEHRPNGLFQNIQDAVYAMRGRTLLMNDAAITGPLQAIADPRHQRGTP